MLVIQGFIVLNFRVKFLKVGFSLCDLMILLSNLDMDRGEVLILLLSRFSKGGDSPLALV
jgi:hypothetical protein